MLALPLRISSYRKSPAIINQFHAPQALLEWKRQQWQLICSFSFPSNYDELQAERVRITVIPVTHRSIVRPHAKEKCALRICKSGYQLN